MRSFTEAGAELLRLNEDLILRKMKKQLECWYAKHTPSSRRVLPKDDDMYIGGSDGEHQPAALRLYDDDDAEPPLADAQRVHGNGGVGV